MSSIVPIDRPVCPNTVEKRVHHIGYLVSSISAMVEDFIETLSFQWDGRIVLDPLQKVRVTFLRSNLQQPSVELIEPSGADSPVHSFLRRGIGFHHICLEVADIENELDQARCRGGLVAKAPLPAVALDGRRIAWVYTRARMLIEYLAK
jgi:methylmalonyl-CoA/ethylmalonyl-CoA epimerase